VGVGNYSAPPSNNIFRHYIMSQNEFYGTLQFLSDNEISSSLFELRHFIFTSTIPVAKDRTIYQNCLRKVLVLADRFQSSISAHDTLRQLARMLSTLLLSHGAKAIQTRVNHFLKGDLQVLWAACTKTVRHVKFGLQPTLTQVLIVLLHRLMCLH